MTGLLVRLAGPADIDAVVHHFVALWPDGTLEEHRDEAELVLAGRAESQRAHTAVGFAVVDRRVHFRRPLR